MNTDKENPLCKSELRQIIGSAMEALHETGLRLDHILNFKQPRLEWKRVVP